MKAKQGMQGSSVHEGKWVVIFYGGVIQFSIVNTHPPASDGSCGN